MHDVIKVTEVLIDIIDLIRPFLASLFEFLLCALYVCAKQPFLDSHAINSTIKVMLDFQ